MDLETEIKEVLFTYPRNGVWVDECVAKILDLVQLEYDDTWYVNELNYWKQMCADISTELELEQNTILKFPTPTKIKDHRWRNLK